MALSVAPHSLIEVSIIENKGERSRAKEFCKFHFYRKDCPQTFSDVSSNNTLPDCQSIAAPALTGLHKRSKLAIQRRYW
jgi:hypothetical protein